MNDRDTPIALVTAASDFAGPPAVDALRAAGLKVLVHDKACHAAGR